MVEKIHSRINGYLNKLYQLGLRDTDINQNQQTDSFIASNLKALTILILGFPIYIYGLINNFLPFEIPSLLAKKISKSIEYRGAIMMVGGLFTFLIFYTAQIVFVWKYTYIQWITIFYGVSLPVTGLFCYWYFHTVNKMRTKWMLMMLFYKKSVLISNLITEREKIIADLDKIKKKYTDHLAMK
jgi:MFS family permease